MSRAPCRQLLVSDVHLREESAKTVFEEVMPGILALCQERSIYHVMALGDWFHLRYRVPVWLMNLQREWLLKFSAAGIAWHFLPGNHDQIDVQGRNALEIFAELENVTVHNDPGWDEHGLWVPYRPALQTIQEAVALPRPKGSAAPKVCWLHYGVSGALQNSRRVDTDGVDPHLFAGFERVLCGHYHKQQDLGPGGKISYVGSPYQTRADEAGDAKGVAILHDYTTLERIDTAWGARFVHSRIDALDDVAALREHGGADASYRITVKAGVPLKQVADRLAAAGIRHYTLTPEPEPFEARLQVADSESLEAYARAYMEANVAAEEHDAYWATFLSVTEGKHDASSL